MSARAGPAAKSRTSRPAKTPTEGSSLAMMRFPCRPTFSGGSADPRGSAAVVNKRGALVHTATAERLSMPGSHQLLNAEREASVLSQRKRLAKVIRARSVSEGGSRYAVGLVHAVDRRPGHRPGLREENNHGYG